MTAPSEWTERLAALLVDFGANVQPGQLVLVSSDVGKEDLTRMVAERCYERGARYVEVRYGDPWVRRARLRHAPLDSLDLTPSWDLERVRALGDAGAALVRLEGAVAPTLLADLDPERVGRERPPAAREQLRLIAERRVNWTIGPCPVPGWAEQVHPDLEPAAALECLWEEIRHVCRLDEPDPVAAWEERMNETSGAAARLTERRFDRVLLEGPGTELSVGLVPSSRWIAARESTAFGVTHHPNLPSEEVFTTPDPERTEGVVTSTRPLQLGGTMVEGLRVRFAGGRAVEIEAERGADVLRTRAAADEGAARLGELALVDDESRIGRLGTVFYDTLLDENAASHLALGAGLDFLLDEADAWRSNESAIHVDFMVGGAAVDVTGVTAEGERVAVLRDGEWRI